MSVCWSNYKILDSSIIESHLWLLKRIIVVFIMCTNNSLKSFCSHASVYSVSAMLTTIDFCFLLIHDIEAKSKENQH